MIEKFTKEELEIIMKEIKELPKQHQKRDLCADSLKKIRDAFYGRESYDGIYYSEIEENIFILADHFLCNYEERRNQKGKYKRSSFVKLGLEDAYKKTVDDITDALLANMREKMINEEH